MLTIKNDTIKLKYDPKMFNHSLVLHISKGKGKGSKIIGWCEIFWASKRLPKKANQVNFSTFRDEEDEGEQS